MSMLPDAKTLEPIADAAGGFHPLFADVPSSVEFNKLRKRLLRLARQAIDDFSMVRPGDRWLVALSGGKDSYGLLALLLDLKWRGLLPVELLACNLDQGQPNFPKHILPDYLNKYAIPHRIEYQDTYSVVTDKLPEGSTYCSLCSRLRRGHLYRIAREEGCSALVLGHHREDILETFFMNLFHGGRLAAMPPKLLNDDGDVMVLRPLAYCAEADLEKFASAMKFPIIPCDLCGSRDGLQRNAMKAMLDGLEKRMPGRKDTMIHAMTNVRPSHLLDRKLFDFAALNETHTTRQDIPDDI
ncbi:MULTISPECIES: tRNA 2-thiocytidine(32) synthetase TtcA [unclassified Mesorhizobium]|uniref:tRNA 2-thiocytidine(32) synthetase TtcA n=1 Tax=unclassified Mesorhizobium TaxID=325217 RepID=UPI000FD3B6BC|nr:MULTISPECIES: tRNA 2-thiocytidine(32) synthetase TtcA [unclassified Mesorhizobium]RVB76548.1 tRNA 2-thiocytidine(32) synthetase TtcA [Mesorhizobium sp. M6A.T.Cr.TU.014.01.1.1]RWP80559.1 MAG: tRNA 2-thiocytidine(32) synthetase TtcA [Mesorhizobium sp.]RWQ02738.1 MAG: tRNA 2-thiocytidine(32) synthetase TtcA [Mesorhizobium sp.]RWQ08404.1 MAG: tRNA 2-thiocytidine(32) synthetase TtcA [Mesorhizobium sp.]RWQ63498.1 MAG: tRNA 2-thiocytidine(32) synthetase TtcA [Mesorhizobium sp.]